MGEAGIVTNTTDVSLQSVGKRWAPTASDIEGPTDLDWVRLCFETEISRISSCPIWPSIKAGSTIAMIKVAVNILAEHGRR
jgi:hypothetical protein